MPSPQPNSHSCDSVEPIRNRRPPDNSRLVRILLIATTILVLGGLLAGAWRVEQAFSSHGVKHSEYQALFLTNNQVYFGHLAITSEGYKLTDVYYLQNNSSSSSSTASQVPSSSQLTLIKLGSEIHAPEDAMFVARPQVLFWENLKTSGKVVQAILKQQGK